MSTRLRAVDALDAAFTGSACEVVTGDGLIVPLPIGRWSGEPDLADRRLLLDPCTGPTLDVGCGPGRLTAALGRRGVPAMGIDISGIAVLRTQRRGAPALRRDVFGEVPATGRWSHVLLADGNVGIGGDPQRLLARVRELLHPGGTVLAEVAGRGVGLRSESMRLRLGGELTRAFSWSFVGIDAIVALAAGAELSLLEIAVASGRYVARLQR
ncbi:MAG: methyltransferase domain-containing protein [Nocardioidaceae bacterium]